MLYIQLVPLFFLLRFWRNIMSYSKTALNIDELISKIKSKWFFVKYDSIVEDFISKNGYFHIVPYIKCFTKKDEDWVSKTEINNLDFDNVISLYNIDIKLQTTLFSALKQIEIYLKSNFIKYSLLEYNDPMWYTKWVHISMNNRNDWINIFQEIQEDRWESDTVKDFFKKYPDEEYLPIRITIEISSFWPFTKLFSYISPNILRQFSLNLWVEYFYKWTSLHYNFSQLKWWLRWFAKLRNRIAHSEITWSPSPLPLIALPRISKPLNTTCSYIQLIKHVLSIIPWEDASEFYRQCYLLLKQIEWIQWITEKEKMRIWITWNWENRFKNVII